MQGQDSSTGFGVIQLPTWPVAAGSQLPRISKQKQAAEPVCCLLPSGSSHLPILTAAALSLRSALPRGLTHNTHYYR
jgi:hypothetical protein